MKNQMKKLIAVVLAFLCLFCSSSVFAENSVSAESAYFNMVYQAINRHFKFDLDKDSLIKDLAERALRDNPALLEEFIDIATSHADDYSQYFTEEEFKQYNQVMNAQYVGIGVTVQRMVGSVGIVSVLPGSTAQMAGLLAGDRILAVDGQDVTDFLVNDLTPLIKGEEGTSVLLTILRDGKKMDISVLRGAIASATTQHQDLGDGIGYLQIASFNNTTPSGIQAADEYFRGKRIKKLIIDLRDNPGGDLISVVNSLGFFVPLGKTVIQIDYSDPSRNSSLRSVGDLKKPYYQKLVVLINGDTASAAELFAGNIRDHKLGTIVGTTSYGKGTVQEFINLPPLYDKDLGYVKLTTAEYLLPSGTPVNEVGIRPDVRVVNPKHSFADEDFEPLKPLFTYKEGDVSDGVLAIKQRFDALGHLVGEVDETFDHELTLLVRQFQKENELPVTGIMDFKTQQAFIKYLDEVEITVDEQFNTALTLLQK